MLKSGKDLNEDQTQALSKFDDVLRALEFSKELEKQFVTLANDTMKQQKKQQWREQQERDEALKQRIREMQRVLLVMDMLGDEQVRTDFLAGAKGAVKLSNDELSTIVKFDKVKTPIICRLWRIS